MGTIQSAPVNDWLATPSSVGTLVLTAIFLAAFVLFGLKSAMQGRPHTARVEKAGGSILLSKYMMEYGLWIFGPVARARGLASDAGEVLDAAVDRWAEMAVFFGYAWYYRSIWWGFILAVGACAGAIMVSYARAKAESFGIDAAMGLMQRHERAVWLALATLGSPIWELWRPTPVGQFAFHTPVLVALGVIAVVANWTGWLRTQYTRQELRKR